MPRPVPSPLAIALTWLRERSAWTQRDLALAVGGSSVSISKYENGQQTLKRERLDQLAAALGYGLADVDLALLTVTALDPAAAATPQATHPQLTSRQHGVRVRLTKYERGQRPLKRERLDQLAATLGHDPADVDLALLTIAALDPTAAAAPQAPLEHPGAIPPLLARLSRRAGVRFAIEAATLAQSCWQPQLAARRIAQDRAQAGDLWQQLARVTPAQRRLLIEHTLEFQGWALAERLAEESRRAAPKNAATALELAQLAVAAARRAGGSDAWLSRLEGYTRAFLANALRVQGSLSSAGAEWQTVWRLWHAGTAGDPAAVLPEWRLLDLEASLRRDARQFAAALDLLDRAAAAAPSSAAGRILVNRASTLEQAGDLRGAVATLRQAEPIVNETREPRLQWLLAFNFSVNLCHLGGFAEAALQLPKLRQLTLNLGNDLDLVRVVWLSGRVAAGMGSRQDACVAFEEVRDQLAARRDGFGTAMVSLELAVLYLEDGRLGEVRRLAMQMSWILAAEGLEREVLAGLQLFCEAARREAATIEQARTVLCQLGPAPHFGAGAL